MQLLMIALWFLCGCYVVLIYDVANPSWSLTWTQTSSIKTQCLGSVVPLAMFKMPFQGWWEWFCQVLTSVSSGDAGEYKCTATNRLTRSYCTKLSSKIIKAQYSWEPCEKCNPAKYYMKSGPVLGSCENAEAKEGLTGLCLGNLPDGVITLRGE